MFLGLGGDVTGKRESEQPVYYLFSQRMVVPRLPSDILNPDSNTQYGHKSDINYVFSNHIFAEFWLLTSPEREQTRWRQQLKFLQS